MGKNCKETERERQREREGMGERDIFEIVNNSRILIENDNTRKRIVLSERVSERESESERERFMKKISLDWNEKPQKANLMEKGKLRGYR